MHVDSSKINCKSLIAQFISRYLYTTVHVSLAMMDGKHFALVLQQTLTYSVPTHIQIYETICLVYTFLLNRIRDYTTC